MRPGLDANTGYGVQVKSVVPRLAALPQVEEIGIFAWYGLYGGKTTWGPYTVYPGFADEFGNDLIGHHARDFRADAVITLIDVWTQQQTAQKVAPARWAPWFPVDAQPAPQMVLDALEGADPPIVYSQFAVDELEKAGVAAAYVPHGIEPDVFKVELDGPTRAEWRRRLVGPGCDHLTVMVAANQGYPDRKAFQVQLRAWAQFAKGKPGARLYVHALAQVDQGGLDLRRMVGLLGIEEQVVFPDAYAYVCGLPAQYLACVYNAADVYLGAAMTEGFGIPIIEAQACGLPVVVTDYAAMPELVRWGIKVPPADLFWGHTNSWWAWPDVQGIADALEELYAMQEAAGGDWPAEFRDAISERMHERYGWDTVVKEYWAPLLEEWAA